MNKRKRYIFDLFPMSVNLQYLVLAPYADNVKKQSEITAIPFFTNFWKNWPPQPLFRKCDKIVKFVISNGPDFISLPLCTYCL